VNEGDTYFFRVATYDSTGKINSLSKPIMTIPGEPEQFAFSLPASQRESPLYYSGLAWSANGKNLAFLKTSGNSVNIMNIDLSTMSVSQVTNYSGTEYRLLGLDWSPDSNWISYSYTSSSTVYELDYRIWLVSPNGGIPHSVTSGRVDASATWISSMSILFTKGSLESVNIPEFYTVDLANNNNEKQLTSDQNIYKYNPSINHSRDLVAFCGYNGSVRFIYTMSLSGSYIEPITPNIYWSDIHPFWLADGQKIIFTSLRSGHYEIWSINIESNQIQQITRSQKRGVERFYGRPSPDGTQFAVLELGSSLNDATIQILLNNAVNVDEYSESLPRSHMLHQNYPNPFNSSTHIQYAVSSRQFVSLKVYDVLGNEIAVLVNEEKPAGSYEVEYNASSLPSGVYFYQLNAGSFIETKKMILLK
ncbi:MAG: T9SS type A sorting domain-containing protein, partial [Bacteroidetes bacterium]|nr:T9SS type A sorting domain-containing protein [Bacteroidota bacterium]